MLAQFTITKAIHNRKLTTLLILTGWNVSSIYNYESHSQLNHPCRLGRLGLECYLNLQLRKPFTTGIFELIELTKVGVLAQFTITKAIHN